MDIYQKEKIKQIKEAKSDEELAKIIDDIYNDGEDNGWYCSNRYWW